MEVSSAGWKIKLAAPSTAMPGTTQPATEATVASPAAMEATYAATTIPTPAAGKQCVSDGPGSSSPAATIPATSGNVHAAATAATTCILVTVECRSMTGRSGRFKGM